MTESHTRTRVAIWNPNSGGAPPMEKLREALGEDVELLATTEDDPGPGQTRQALSSGADTIVACGGDGTVRACIDPLRHAAASLDVVPLGTGNLLASNLGIPSGLDAAGGAGDRPERTIDVGLVNGEAFAVMAGTGFDALMIRDADERAKSLVGTLAYVWSGAKNLHTRLVPTTIEVDGRPFFDGRTSMVLVGNFGTITGGLEVFPDADPADGVLDVAVMKVDRIRDWGSVLWRLLTGKPQRAELVTRIRGSEVVVRTDSPRPYELDGEEREPTTELSFSVDPSALRVHHEVVDQ